MIGFAVGEAYGNAFNWKYYMDLKVGVDTLRVHFNDLDVPETVRGTCEP